MTWGRFMWRRRPAMALCNRALNDKLIYVNNYHTHNTRSASNNVLVLPKPNIELFKTSLVYKGPQLWNNLPHDIQCVSDVSVFKECLKIYLMKQ